MDVQHFDTIAKRFAHRRLSRRRALARGGAGLAAGALAAAGLRPAAAQNLPSRGVEGSQRGDATPAPPPAADHGPTMLFLQSFQRGGIAPKDGEEGVYTLTLEQGLGQTIYFSDRPDRVVGATPTDRFLDALGFSPENPPNAALVIEPEPGHTDVTVVELFAPVFDPAGLGVTYDVRVLAEWEDSLAMGFQEAPTDLAELHPTFGAAHLFIDDCGGGGVECWKGDEMVPGPISTRYCYSGWKAACLPCSPWYDDFNDLVVYWTRTCNELPECEGNCTPRGLCFGPFCQVG